MRMLHTDSVKARNSLVYHANVSSSSCSRVVVLTYLQSKVTEGSAYAAGTTSSLDADLWDILVEAETVAREMDTKRKHRLMLTVKAGLRDRLFLT